MENSTQNSAFSFIFSHPDFTVGSGITPDQLYVIHIGHGLKV